MSTDISAALIKDWEEIKNIIKTDCALTDISYDTWIKPLSFLKYVDNTVYILIPTDSVIQQQYLEMNYIDFFRVVISEKVGINLNVVFLLKKDTIGFFGDDDENFDKANEFLENEDTSSYINVIGLNNKYRFDNFVVGSNNTFAHSASLAVAEAPGSVYNPLFLYGGPGLGKTHLMHSIGHYIAAKNPLKKILYVTSEEFTNEIIDSMRSVQRESQVMTKVREKYRSVDVLLIDDIQFIIGKESTQLEFFHTFNALHQAGKQVVISSDRPPKQMETLDERFRSRFEMGLIADILPPDYETKMAIIKKLSEQYPIEIDDTAFSYISNNIKSNIRELEGAFNKLIAYSRIHSLSNVTENIAITALKDVLHPDSAKIITTSKIIDTVCEQCNVQKSDLLSKKRDAEIVLPRQIVMYLCRKYLSSSNSYKEIGQALGRDHSTVISGVERVSNMLETDADLKRTVDIIVKKIDPPY